MSFPCLEAIYVTFNEGHIWELHLTTSAFYLLYQNNIFNDVVWIVCINILSIDHLYKRDRDVCITAPDDNLFTGNIRPSADVVLTTRFDSYIS